MYRAIEIIINESVKANFLFCLSITNKNQLVAHQKLYFNLKNESSSKYNRNYFEQKKVVKKFCHHYLRSFKFIKYH